jgi:hypothetical protein
VLQSRLVFVHKLSVCLIRGIVTGCHLPSEEKGLPILLKLYYRLISNLTIIPGQDNSKWAPRRLQRQDDTEDNEDVFFERKGFSEKVVFMFSVIVRSTPLFFWLI